MIVPPPHTTIITTTNTTSKGDSTNPEVPPSSHPSQQIGAHRPYPLRELVLPYHKPSGPETYLPQAPNGHPAENKPNGNYLEPIHHPRAPPTS